MNRIARPRVGNRRIDPGIDARTLVDVAEARATFQILVLDRR